MIGRKIFSIRHINCLLAISYGTQFNLVPRIPRIQSPRSWTPYRCDSVHPLHILCAGMVATQLRMLFISFHLILILQYSLFTATLSLITVFRIYDHNDKCFRTQRVLITITSQKGSQLGLKETEIPRLVQLTEAGPKAERAPRTASTEGGNRALGLACRVFQSYY